MRHRASRPLPDLIPPRYRLAILTALALVSICLAITATGLPKGPPGDRAASRPGAEEHTSGDLPSSPRGSHGDPRLPSPGSPTTLSSRASAPSRKEAAGAGLGGTPGRRARERSAGAPSPTGTAPTEPADEDRPPDTTAWTTSSTRDSWEVQFSADEPAEFECSFDGAAFAPCSSPIRYTDLKPGKHTLSVRAIDRSGTADPTPAELTWHPNGAGPGNGQ